MKNPERQEEFPIQINGVDYTMSYKFGDLADGEAAANKKWGHGHVNIMQVYIAPTWIHIVKDVFAASLERYHPEIPFNDRRKLVTLANFTYIVGIQYSVFGEAIADARKGKDFARFAAWIPFQPRATVR